MERYEFAIRLPENYEEFFQHLLTEKLKKHNPTMNSENLMMYYKKTIISLVKHEYKNIVPILKSYSLKICDPITDPQTQARINAWFADHIKANKLAIFEPLDSLFGEYVIEDNKMVADFEKDYQIVKNYLSEAYTYAVARSIGEYIESIEKQAELDSEMLVKLSKIVYSTPKDQISDAVAEFCSKNDKSLMEKYAVIIVNMDKFGFNPSHFYTTMRDYGMNLSKPYKDVMLKYFSLVLKKDKSFHNNISQIRKFIDAWNLEMQKLKDADQFVRDQSDQSTRKKYASWVNK